MTYLFFSQSQSTFRAEIHLKMLKASLSKINSLNKPCVCNLIKPFLFHAVPNIFMTIKSVAPSQVYGQAAER